MYVAFDGDDTLWHNEDQFQVAHREFEAMLSTWADADEVDACLYRTEMRNLHRYGYGVKSFMLAMLEASVEISDGRAGADVVSSILALGHDLLDRPAVLLNGITGVLDALAGHHLLLITKGDLRHQLTLIERSGLADRFAAIEVVAEKDPGTYATVLARHGIPIDKFVMVGNSMRSDIAPVIELGGRAVHIPYHVTWVHESDHHLDADRRHSRVATIETVIDLPAVIGAWS